MERASGTMFSLWGLWLTLLHYPSEFTTGLTDLLPAIVWGVVLLVVGSGQWIAAKSRFISARRAFALLALVVWLTLASAAWRKYGLHTPSAILLCVWVWMEWDIYRCVSAEERSHAHTHAG